MTSQTRTFADDAVCVTLRGALLGREGLNGVHRELPGYRVQLVLILLELKGKGFNIVGAGRKGNGQGREGF